jgi:hypothetical protein
MAKHRLLRTGFDTGEALGAEGWINAIRILDERDGAFRAYTSANSTLIAGCHVIVAGSEVLTPNLDRGHFGIVLLELRK